jgi:hypothetical protein
MTLAALNLEKSAFVATSAAIDFIIDVYLNFFNLIGITMIIQALRPQ